MPEFGLFGSPLRIVRRILALYRKSWPWATKLLGVRFDFDFVGAEGDGVGRFDLNAVVGGILVVRRGGFLAG